MSKFEMTDETRSQVIEYLYKLKEEGLPGAFYNLCCDACGTLQSSFALQGESAGEETVPQSDKCHHCGGTATPCQVTHYVSWPDGRVRWPSGSVFDREWVFFSWDYIRDVLVRKFDILQYEARDILEEFQVLEELYP